MKGAEFWRIVEDAKSRGGDKLRQTLTKLPMAEVVAFEAQLRQLLERAFTWDLWGAAMLRNGSGNVQGFVRFLNSVVARGRQTYARALKNPDSLVGHPTGENEELGPAVQAAYVKKTGEQPPPWRLARPAGTRWNIRDRRELARRLPRMYGLEIEWEFQAAVAEGAGYAKTNKLARANECYRKALGLLAGAPHIGIPVVHGNLMINEAVLGAIAKARAHLKSALATIKSLPPYAARERALLEYQIAWFYREHGSDASLPEALRLSRRSQKGLADPLDAMEIEMQILLRQGREMAARAVAVKALEINKRHPDFQDAKRRWRL